MMSELCINHEVGKRQVQALSYVTFPASQAASFQWWGNAFNLLFILRGGALANWLNSVTFGEMSHQLRLTSKKEVGWELIHGGVTITLSFTFGGQLCLFSFSFSWAGNSGLPPGLFSGEWPFQQLLGQLFVPPTPSLCMSLYIQFSFPTHP